MEYLHHEVLTVTQLKLLNSLLLETIHMDTSQKYKRNKNLKSKLQNKTRKA